MLSLIQFRTRPGERGVAVLREDGRPLVLPGVHTTLELATRACRTGAPLAELVAQLGAGAVVDLSAVELLAPIDHADPAHLLLSGTGLTHAGSAHERDRMHRALSEKPQQSDSMKMFMMGLQGGKPVKGQRGVQPEWFFKGDGSCVVAPGGMLFTPDFALDAGEEPEIAAVYLIDAGGNPMRIGFALANEFSDHVMERENYLWLAHSKLRPAALGPELLIGELPARIAGMSRILRDDQVLWEKPFASGEENMSHSLENLEYHHFKYALFRRPGDVHVHFLGTGTLSFADDVRTQPGDVFEITAAPFLLPLRNTLGTATASQAAVRAL